MSSTTPNLALPYPDLADTADVPRDIKNLAQKLDALLGGGGTGGGSGTAVGNNLPILDTGMAGQIRAGRQLSVADFTSLGLSTPAGLFNLGGLTNLGSGGPLVNLGAVPFGTGINGTASTAAVFAGSTGQALYINDTGAADPFRIKTGSWGCWFRTAKRATTQYLIAKQRDGAAYSWGLSVSGATSAILVISSINGIAIPTASGVSDVLDDRWHFAVGTFDGTTIAAYVDGVLEGSAPNPGALFGAGVPLNIGAYGADAGATGVTPCYGRVDEAFVTPDVLTEDQVRCLYAASLTHSLGATPAAVRLNVHRRRRGAPLAVADFPAQPVRLHNFTGGAVTDQGSGAVTLTANNGGGTSVAGADGAPAGAMSQVGTQSFSSTDAGLPGGLTARSYGCWFKTANAAVAVVMSWGTLSAAHANLLIYTNGLIASSSGADLIQGPYVADGQWHQAIVAEDNTAGDGVRRKLWLDGRLVGTSTVLNSITLAGANRFRIGANPDGLSPFTGQIDAAFVTNTALTQPDILTLYARGSQDPGASPKNSGDHVERADATSVLFIGDTLQSQMTVDLGVVA